MNNIFTDEKEIEILKEAGKRLALIMNELEKFIQVGTVVDDINTEALKLIARQDAKPATVGYKPDGASYPFPAAVCVSINNEVAHGISKGSQRVIEDGDLVSCDIVIEYKGLFVDVCRTYGIGNVSEKGKRLIECARKTTDNAIKMAQIGNTTEDIGEKAENTAQGYGFDTVKELGGHGVGRKIHQQPFIPNGKNLGVPIVKIKEGMVLAIEPIIAEKDWKIKLEDDDYLFTTKDGALSTQFEETVLITKDGPEVLTKI